MMDFINKSYLFFLTYKSKLDINKSVAQETFYPKKPLWFLSKMFCFYLIKIDHFLCSISNSVSSPSEALTFVSCLKICHRISSVELRYNMNSVTVLLLIWWILRKKRSSPLISYFWNTSSGLEVNAPSSWNQWRQNKPAAGLWSKNVFLVSHLSPLVLLTSCLSVWRVTAAHLHFLLPRSFTVCVVNRQVYLFQCYTENS